MPDKKRVRLLIADDHPIVLEGLCAVLAREPDLMVVAQASNGSEAVELFRLHRPDVTLMDFSMPLMSGLEALIIIQREFSTARVVMLTNYDGDEVIYRALRAGACGYLLKDAPREELLQTIRAASQGQVYLSTHVAARLALRVGKENLTGRELEVLHLMAEGKSNLEIGNSLFITEGTVKSHVTSILTKMNANDRTQAVVMAVKRGLVLLTA